MRDPDPVDHRRLDGAPASVRRLEESRMRIAVQGRSSMLQNSPWLPEGGRPAIRENVEGGADVAFSGRSYCCKVTEIAEIVPVALICALTSWRQPR